MTFNFKKSGNKYWLRLKKGDEIMQTLVDFCAAEGINTASVCGIGAVSDATLGCRNPITKVYEQHSFSKPMEVTSLIGNITLNDGKPYAHLHITLAGNDFAALGGHLISSTIAATGEIALDTQSEVINRVFSHDIGINLMDI